MIVKVSLKCKILKDSIINNTVSFENTEHENSKDTEFRWSLFTIWEWDYDKHWGWVPIIFSRHCNEHFQSIIFFNPHKYLRVQIVELSEPLITPTLPTSSPKGLNKILFSLSTTVCSQLSKFHVMRQINTFPDDLFSFFYFVAVVILYLNFILALLLESNVSFTLFLYLHTQKFSNHSCIHMLSDSTLHQALW